MVNGQRSKVKAAIKREQSDACISYAEREQVRCETSKVNKKGLLNDQTTKRLNNQTTNNLND